jgi:hypothetical protein
VLRLAVVSVLFPVAVAFARDVQQTREDGAMFVGSVGCKSSSCHGGAGEKRSQYITWSQKDYHTRAYTILLDARSARISEAVGVPEAQSNARCTVCHSPFQSVSQSRLQTTARPDEGVSCESCHGAAEPWLRGHTRSDWTYAMRVTAGMHDLRNLYVRANACVACHQNVDADILKAGHPALVFELDSQSNNEPKHWKDDDPAIGPRSWLVGQAVALREIAWALNNTAQSGQNNQNSPLLYQQNALTWLLDKAGFGNGVSQMNSFAGIQGTADGIAKRAANWSPSNEELMSMLRTLAGSDSEFNLHAVESNFLEAQRLTLALDRLSAALNLSDKIDHELSALREDVKRGYDFQPATFAEHLRAFARKL